MEMKLTFIFILSLLTIVGFFPVKISAVTESTSGDSSSGQSGGVSSGSSGGEASGDTAGGGPQVSVTATAEADAAAKVDDPDATAIGSADGAATVTAQAIVGDNSVIGIAISNDQALARGVFDNCTYCKYQCSADFGGFGTKPNKKCPCCPWPCECKCVEFQTGTGKCKDLLDVIFVLDESGSIGSTDRLKQIDFVKQIVGTLNNVGPDQRVAMVQFSTKARLNWNLKDPISDSEQSLINGIDSLTQVKGYTNIVDALNIVSDDIIGSPDDDPKKPNVVILVTDGRENFKRGQLASAGARVQAGAKVIAVGVTKTVQHDELVEIAGDENNVFEVDTFDGLFGILKDAVKRICDIKKEERCYCCCSVEQFFAGGGTSYFW